MERIDRAATRSISCLLKFQLSASPVPKPTMETLEKMSEE